MCDKVLVGIVWKAVQVDTGKEWLVLSGTGVSGENQIQERLHRGDDV